MLTSNIMADLSYALRFFMDALRSSCADFISVRTRALAFTHALHITCLGMPLSLSSFRTSFMSSPTVPDFPQLGTQHTPVSGDVAFDNDIADSNECILLLDRPMVQKNLSKNGYGRLLRLLLLLASGKHPPLTPRPHGGRTCSGPTASMEGRPHAVFIGVQSWWWSWLSWW